jgi:hypothetical protein
VPASVLRRLASCERGRTGGGVGWSPVTALTYEQMFDELFRATGRSGRCWPAWSRPAASSSTSGPRLAGPRSASCGSATAEVLRSWLQAREPHPGADCYLKAAGHLAMSVEAAGIDDFVIDKHDRPVTDLGTEVLARSGWL